MGRPAYRTLPRNDTMPCDTREVALMIESLERGAEAAREARTLAQSVQGMASDAIGNMGVIRPSVATIDVVDIATAMTGADEAAKSMDAAMVALTAMAKRYREWLADTRD